MSLLTRCPACTTIYKVVPDQLRISQGWVKCGQCGDIFDATQHLVHIEPQTPPAVSDPSASVEVSPPGGDEVAMQPSVGEELHDPDMHAESDFQANVEVFEVDLPEVVDASVVGDVPALSIGVQGDDVLIDQPTQLGAGGEGAFQPRAVTGAPEGAEESTLAALPAVEEPSFIRHARRALFWRRPWVRAVLLVLALLLLFGLVAQWVYRERQLLSAAQPQWKPALQVFCQVLECQIEPLRRIESVSIDAASFNKIDDVRYRLSFVLKNSADLPLAMPSIELTLTDLQERVVVQRVFSAQELDNSVVQLRPASVWQVNALLSLDGDAYARRVVGYRVLAFYP